MASSHILMGAGDQAAEPTVRSIAPADLVDALKKGWDDFAAMPSHAVFLCVIYPAVGIMAAAMTLGFAFMPLLFPAAAGFALIGPIAAVGLYELSRRREAGLEVSAADAFEVLRSPSIGAIVALGLVLAAIFLTWMATANAIYTTYFGYGSPESVSQFVHDLFFTREGWSLIVVGNTVGLLFAIAAYAVSVVSFPLLLDHDVGVTGAVTTSLRLILRNPLTMALWGLIIAALLVIGMIPLFMGLSVVLPVLGHATWHVYRKGVVADQCARADFRPRPAGKHSAADFPVSLFKRTED
jgi:uncharacterized membrane protein